MKSINIFTALRDELNSMEVGIKLELLASGVINNKELIARHPEAKYLRYISGKCLQFNSNGFSRSIEIPVETNYFKFHGFDVHGERGRHVTHIEYGEVVFYSHNDNILKVEAIG
ncbi:MAG: hypothetical protein WC548_02075 [Candidatus Pacearchaeota archaeon]